MDLSASVDKVQDLVAKEYDLNVSVAEAGNASALWDRIAAELHGPFLSEDEWEGDAPFSPFADRLDPPPTVTFKKKVLRVLVPRAVFKAEHWSAPDVGGVARIFVSGKQKAESTYPLHALDLADLAGETRIVAMHDVCGHCNGSGEADGAACSHTDAEGVACLDGLKFKGGLAFDPGSHEGSERTAEPRDGWAALMER